MRLYRAYSVLVELVILSLLKTNNDFFGATAYGILVPLTKETRQNPLLWKRGFLTLDLRKSSQPIY